MTVAAPNLEYASSPTRRHRWFRRARRWALVAVVAVAVGLGGPPAYRAGRVAYLQWACGRYAAPPDAIVCDEPGRFGGVTTPFLAAAPDPEPLTALAELDSEAYGLRPFWILGYDPNYRPPWAALGRSTPKINRDGPVLFLHWRTTAGGRERLVIVRRTPPAFRQSWDAPLAFHVAAVPRVRPWDGWPQDRPVELPEVVPQVFSDDPTKVAVRFYAGQPDAADASRFTVRFEADGQPGTLVGRLVDAPGEEGDVRVELSTMR